MRNQNTNRVSFPRRILLGWQIHRTILAIVVAAILVTGCSMFNRESEEQKSEILNQIDKNAAKESLAKEQAEKVRFDGGLLLGNADNLAFTPVELSQVLVELIDEQKWNTLKHTVAAYPDITLKLLTEADGQSMPWSHLKIVARLFDIQWRGEGPDSWQQFVEELESSAGTAKNLTAARSEFLQLLMNNQPSKALALRLEKIANSNTSLLARAEVARLEGVACLMLEQYNKSINSLTKAKDLVVSNHPYVASHIGLLLGEAYRHSKKLDLWKRSWQEAIEIQSVLSDQKGLNDPAFWNKAAFLRPVDSSWPTVVIERLKSKLAEDNLHFSTQNSSNTEAVIWATIAMQSLRRHESQNAILAFKKSEATLSDKSLKNELRMQQAIAMIDSGQPGPASAILMRLSSNKGLLADRAKAVLATLKLQNGSLAQGMNLLQSAIKTANEWPTSERLRAQADFGLALLMRGREEQGVALLNQVHQEFLAEKNYEHATQCLWNLAKYFEKTEQNELHETTIVRMQELESAL